jgi:hypothetical protein
MNLLKLTKVPGCVGEHRRKAVLSPVVEVVQKQVAVAHPVVQTSAVVNPMDK